MAITLVDLSGDTYEPYGPFETPQQAHRSAKRSGFISYALWEEGKRTELVKDASKVIIYEDGE